MSLIIESSSTPGQIHLSVPPFFDGSFGQILATTGLSTYTTTGEGIAGTTEGQFFFVPASPMGLNIYENVAGVATLRGGALLQQQLSDGSAANPSLTFSADTNTGIYRVGADSIGFTTGGVLRAFLNSTGLSVTGTVTGTAVNQTTTDTTANRLVRNGDHGIGGASILVDANAVGLRNGFVRYVSNSPFGGFGANGVNLIGAVDSLSGQLAIKEVSLSSEPGLVAVRSRTSAGAWTAWNTLFGRANLLGTVSQSAGVPTGAVVERGSNANGEYVRFADGTQICIRLNLSAANASTALGALFRSADVAWTFPAAFIADPFVTGDVDDADAWVSANTRTATTVNLRVLSAATKAGALNIVGFASGRWF